MVKKIIGIGITLLVATLMFGCSGPPEPTESKCAWKYQGTHMLRQIGQQTISATEWHASYFLIAGSSSGATVTESKVTFAWQANDGAYQFMTLPMDRIRIRLDDRVGIPYVKFRWATYTGGTQCSIIYAELGVNPKDWPVKINVPQVQ